jgi:hypothetical protein
MSLDPGVRRSVLACASPASSRARTALRVAVLFGASAGALAASSLGTGSSAQAASVTPPGAPAALTQQAAQAATPVVEQAARTAAPAVKQAAQAAAPAVKQAAQTTAPAVKQAAQAATPAVKQAARTAAPAVKQAAQAAAPAVKQAAQAATPAVEQAARTAAPAVKQAAQAATPAVEQAVRAATPVTKPVTDVTEVARRAAEAIRAVSEATTKIAAPVTDSVADSASVPVGIVVGVPQPVVSATDAVSPIVTAVALPVRPAADIAGPALAPQTDTVTSVLTIVQTPISSVGVTDIALPAAVAAVNVAPARPVTDALEVPASGSSLGGLAPLVPGADTALGVPSVTVPDSEGPLAALPGVTATAGLLAALGVGLTRDGPRAPSSPRLPAGAPATGVPVRGLPAGARVPMPAGAPGAAGAGGGQRTGGGSGELVSVVPAPTVLIADGGLSARMAAKTAMHSSEFVDGLIVPV